MWIHTDRWNGWFKFHEINCDSMIKYLLYSKSNWKELWSHSISENIYEKKLKVIVAKVVQWDEHSPSWIEDLCLRRFPMSLYVFWQISHWNRVPESKTNMIRLYTVCQTITITSHGSYLSKNIWHSYRRWKSINATKHKAKTKSLSSDHSQLIQVLMCWVIRVDNLCSIYMEMLIRCEFTQTDGMDG